MKEISEITPIPPTFETTQPDLRIEKIEPKDYPSAIKTVETWEAFAKSNYKACNHICPLYDSVYLFELINEKLESPRSDQEAFFCKNDRGQIEGMMVIRTSFIQRFPEIRYCISIETLLTHPKNLSCSENKDTSKIQVKGVGKELLKRAEEKALELQRDIRLISNESAWSFYEKMGFEPTAHHSLGEMYKSVAKIKGLLAA